MLLIFLSWCYILFTAYNLGYAVDKTARLKCGNFVTIVFLGLVAAPMIASMWAIFGRINIEFHCFLLLCNLVLFFVYRIPILNEYRLLRTQLTSFRKTSKWYLILILLLLLVQSAAPSHSIDNETYYIQTIKWLNKYGFVNGLANLHIFLGQTSGWHVLQSAFDFSFLYGNFNDLNGFCLLLGNLFVLQKSENQDSPAFLVFFPLANLLLFPFVGAPSPDLAVCVIGLMVFFYFLERFENCTSQSFNIIFIFSAFLVFVKITAWPILLFPISLLLLNFRKMVRHIAVSYIFGMLILTLLVLKNTILTGYPLFPSAFMSEIVASDFKLPAASYNFWFNNVKLYDFIVTRTQYNHLGAGPILMRWLLNSGIDSIFNCAIVFFVLILPIIIWRKFNYKKYWILYLGLVLQVIFMFMTSPQFRFALHFILFFTLLIASVFITNKNAIAALTYISIIGIFILVLVPIPSQPDIFTTNRFSAENIIFPCRNSNLKTILHPEKMGDLQYISPDHSTFIWATGDGDLPCVSQTQLRFLERKTGYIPQQRTNDLPDGFRAMKTPKK